MVDLLLHEVTEMCNLYNYRYIIPALQNYVY